MRATIVYAASLILFTGCAVPMASPDADASAKSFQPSPGRARIYVFRDTVIGAAVVHQVVIDGEFVAATGPHTFVMKDVPPGEHTVTSQTERSVGRVKIHAIAGQCYFVRQQPYFAMGPGVALRLVDPDTGKQAVLKCNLAE